MELFGRHTASAERFTSPHGADQPPVSARAEISVTVPDGLSDDAIARIQMVIAREAERVAQISAVDLRDQGVAQAEAAHLATVPAQRPVMFVQAGVRRDPKTGEVVTQNAVQRFWRSETGDLIPESDAGARKAIEQYAAAAKAHPRGIPHVDDGKAAR